MDILEQQESVESRLCALATAKKVPINGCFELLPLCNMNCDMCYVRLDRETMEKQGRLRTADEWLMLAKEMKKAGTLFILLTGGEPFLYPEFKRLYTELLQMGMIITINTNGTMIDEEWAEFLGTYRPRRVNITLYGSNDVVYADLCHYPGGFRKVIQGIKLLKAQQVDVKLNGSLVKSNKESWKDLVTIAEELQVPIKIDTYMYPATRERNLPYNMQARLEPEEAARLWMEIYEAQCGTEAFAEYARKSMKTFSETKQQPVEAKCMDCRAGRSSFIINWKGQMHPCIMMSQPAVPVFEVGFENAWKKIVDWTEQIVLSKACASCEHREVCTVCAASTFLEGGDFETKPDYVCKFAEYMLKYQRERLEQLDGQ